MKEIRGIRPISKPFHIAKFTKAIPKPLKVIRVIANSIAVNITPIWITLPFIRLSVDHGTAYEIAGKNQADFSSMAEALKTSVSLL